MLLGELADACSTIPCRETRTAKFSRVERGGRSCVVIPENEHKKADACPTRKQTPVGVVRFRTRSIAIALLQRAVPPGDRFAPR